MQTIEAVILDYLTQSSHTFTEISRRVYGATVAHSADKATGQYRLSAEVSDKTDHALSALEQDGKVFYTAGDGLWRLGPRR